MSDCQSTTPIQAEISQQHHHEALIWGFDENVSTSIGWIAIAFVKYIHSPLRMNCNIF